MYAELEHREWTQLLIRLIRHCPLARFRPGQHDFEVYNMVYLSLRTYSLVAKVWPYWVQKNDWFLQPGKLWSFKKLFSITENDVWNAIWPDLWRLRSQGFFWSKILPTVKPILRVGTLSRSCHRIMITMTWRILKSWNTFQGNSRLHVVG